MSGRERAPTGEPSCRRGERPGSTGSGARSREQRRGRRKGKNLPCGAKPSASGRRCGGRTVPTGGPALSFARCERGLRGSGALGWLTRGGAGPRWSLGCGCGPLLGQEKEKGRTGLGWWGWAAGPRARLRTGLPQRDEVGRRPGREERGNWARVGFGLSFQGCLGFGPGCKSLGWAHMFELGLS